MHVISIYNNKGGEGKSTVTVGLAEFLAANRQKRVLVIDLDAQASSTCALIGHQSLNTAVDTRQTSVDLLLELRRTRKRVDTLEKFLIWRAASEARGSALDEIALMVPDGGRMFDVEESMDSRKDHGLFRRFLKPALTQFDYVLIDLPANITRGSLLSINGLAMSDFVVIPVRPSRISLNGLPRTFEMIDYVRTVNGNGRPAVLGLLRNATDKRFQQYKANFPAIEEAVQGGEMPPLFKNHWLPKPALESATDDNRHARTLKERFGDVYDPCRKVAVELDQLCKSYEFGQPEAPVKKSLWQRLGLA